MATYEELFKLRQNSTLLNKITTAIAIKCKAVIDSSAIAAQKDWARRYIQNPESLKDKIIWPMLVANKDKDVATIIGVDEAPLQTNVDNAIADIIADLTDPV
jgi:hypothetical protein